MLSGKGPGRAIPWGQFFIEALLVVFSVLLALGVKSWYDAREQEQLASRALRNLHLEVVENKAEIERVFDYHVAFLDSLRSANPPTSIQLNSPNMQNNAWEVAQSSGAVSFIDFEIIEIASKIEELQSNYQDFLMRTTEIIMTYNFQSDLEAERISGGLRTVMQGVVNYERSLLSLYGEALNRMERRGIALVQQAADD